MATEDSVDIEDGEGCGSSPAARGGAGVYIEGELGAFYLLSMLSHTEPRGLPGAQLENVRFQGVEHGYALDDLVLQGATPLGGVVLEIQSKRTITFAPKDVIFREVCGQISKSSNQDVDNQNHCLAVATQRTSRAISGPYQDVLQWAHTAATSAEFFSRLQATGVANPSMRDFVATFRKNLVSTGITDEDESIWQILRRFLILEFDFEAVSSLARTHAISLARQVLAPEDMPRAEALWGNLIEISIETAKVGGALNHRDLSDALTRRGFLLSGDRSFAAGRERLAEMARHALANIGNSVGGVHLPRFDAVAAVDDALDRTRFIEIRGQSGVGKSSVLRHFAERLARESHIVVLDPIATPEGGWGGLALSLGVSATANAFLTDLAASGGGILFIDSLDMFTDARQQRTVNDLLREANTVGGFTVVTTARPDFGQEGESWLASDLLTAFGAPITVTVGELQPNEIEILRGGAPALRALLAPGNPAAPMARNLYRLSRLLKVSDTASVRTEAALADHWWRTADGVPVSHVRPAQRILSDLVDCALQGQPVLELKTDSDARTHLLRSLSLSEVRRDHFTFYHDVLRDWAVACRLHEDTAILAGMDLSAQVSHRLARGIELAARLALERNEDCQSWSDLLTALSPSSAHGSWRRQALMAIVHSEIGSDLLERCSELLLDKGAALFQDICRAVISTETEATADVIKAANPEAATTLPRSLRTNTTGSATRLLLWALRHQDDLPIQSFGAVLDLVEVQFLLISAEPVFAQNVSKMLFGWLHQLDVRSERRTIPSYKDAGGWDSSAYGRLVKDLRQWTLLLAAHAADETKAYLSAVAVERDHYKVKAIRAFSKSLASVAPAEFANLISTSLIEPEERKSSRRRTQERTFTYADSDYLPASPAQPPFVDLLEADPQVGLALIRQLTNEAVAFHSGGKSPEQNGFQLAFEAGVRFFPWVDSYLWSRDQAREYSVASGLKALEAWGHARLDAGEPVDTVLSDILGPKGSCAAYLLVAIDVLLSHWPATREALVPFVSCPELLAADRGRQGHDQIGMGRFGLGDEPTGKITLSDLAKRPSREIPLERVLPYYLLDDAVSVRVRVQLRKAVDVLGSFNEHASFSDPAFMGSYALNLLDQKNWVDATGRDGYKAYQSPPAEAAHLARMAQMSKGRMEAVEIDAKIRMAIGDRSRGAAALAREAADHAQGALPDANDTDVLKTRSTQLVAIAMLIARDGDDTLLATHEAWVRAVIQFGIQQDRDDSGSDKLIEYNQPALAACTLVYLWHRKRQLADRNDLIAFATRNGTAAALAFSVGFDELLATDARVVKATMRSVFASCRWRWHRWDEDEAEQERYLHDKTLSDEKAATAEMAWLDGAAEPAWPKLPETKTLLRRPLSTAEAYVDEGDEGRSDEARESDNSVDAIHFNTHTAAKWLQLVADKRASKLGWVNELTDTYGLWSARLNGYGLPPHAEPDDRHSDWNVEFYSLMANALLDMSEARFEDELNFISGLPDRSFGDVTETLVHAADVAYFNNAARSADRPVRLRAKLIERAMVMSGWRSRWETKDLSVGFDTGGVVAKLLLNTHNPFGSTKSYLVPTVFDRIDPLLAPIAALLPGGPTSFVALCTMNTLLVAPRTRHLEFLLSGIEAWLDRSKGDPTMWVELRIGAKIFEWFDTASVEAPTLLKHGHPLRSRIDAALSRLVDLGVPEAHELASRVEQA